MSSFDLIKRFLGNAGQMERRAVPRSGVPKAAWVLVVDDSPTIRAVLGKMLTQDSHVVFKAGDGETAIEMARKELPDLIFLDIVLPGMNGFAVLRALRRDPLTHNIPIVMISGNVQATEQFYVQRYGADDFMKKPFGRGEVFARIQQLTKTGRLVVRQRLLEDMLPREPEHTEAEHTAIPDIAMPDPHQQHVPDLGAPDSSRPDSNRFDSGPPDPGRSDQNRPDPNPSGLITPVTDP
jgi:twitching motility two-component system response regulator PilH